jgi:hypothetical protein
MFEDAADRRRDGESLHPVTRPHGKILSRLTLRKHQRMFTLSEPILGRRFEFVQSEWTTIWKVS